MKRRVLKKVHSRFASKAILALTESSSWIVKLSDLAIDEELAVSAEDAQDLPPNLKGWFIRFHLKYIVSRVQTDPIDELLAPGAWRFKLRALEFPSVYECALEYPKRA